MGLNSYCFKKILKKLTIITILLAISTLTIACKEEVVLKKVPVIEEEEELPYEKIEDLSDEKFDTLTSSVRDRVMVFDIAEVHDEIYPTLKSNVDINTSDEKIEAQIEIIIDPFMEEWTSNKIRDYLTDELGEISESDVERFKDKINNKSLIDFIIVYEKNFLKGNK